MPSLEGFRLSPQQRRLWRAAADPSRFRAECRVEVDGPLDEGLLCEALERVIARHEILRTSFQQLPGTSVPLQVITARTTPSYRSVGGDGDESTLGANRLESSDDAIVRVTRDRSGLAFSLPALCADPRTLVCLVRELGSELSGLRPDEDVVQYGAFAEWYRDVLAGSESDAGRAFWRAQRPLPDVHVLWDRSSHGEFRPHSHWTLLDRDRIACAADLPEFLLTVWAALLGRLVPTSAIEIGVLFDDRPEAIETAMGLFAHPVPVPLLLEPPLDFAAAARRVASAYAAARDRQDAYDEDRALPFQFSAERWPDPVAAGAATLRYRRRSFCAEPFRLRLAACLQDDAVHLEFAYDASRFSATAIEYLARSFATLADKATSGGPLHALPSMSDADLRTVLIDWNRTAVAVESAGGLSALFERQVARTPDAVALETADRQVSFRELHDMAGRVSTLVREQGAGPETLVAICAYRSIEAIAALLGVLHSGAAFLPLDPLDPHERRRRVLDAARPQALIADRHFFEDLSARQRVISLEAACATASVPGQAPIAVSADHMAYVIYTSGSTGEPKGVVVRHGSVVNLLTALDRRIYDGRSVQRVALNAPLHLDASVKQWIQLLHGRTVHVIPDEIRVDPAAMAAYAVARGVDVLDCTPAQARAMLDADKALPPIVLVGGEAIDGATWRRLSEHRSTCFFNMYGPTECTVDAAVGSVSGTTPSLGRPIANTRAYLLSGELDAVPLGAVGELCIGGSGLARAYLNRADLTAERFIPDPFGGEPGARLYRTGDLARHMESGELAFVGRRDGQIKLRGHRIELQEIEAILLEHPAIHQAAVVTRGEVEAQALVAHVAGAASPPLLTAWLRERLPAFMVPSSIVVHEHMPLTAGGKIDRRALAETVTAAAAAGPTPYAQPRTQLEHAIAGIWKRVLAVPRVGLDDNFFELGGHSLLLASAYHDLRSEVPVDFSLLEMFRYPTVGTLAAFLARQQDGSIHDDVQARAMRRRQAMAGRRPTRPPAGGAP